MSLPSRDLQIYCELTRIIATALVDLHLREGKVFGFYRIYD